MTIVAGGGERTTLGPRNGPCRPTPISDLGEDAGVHDGAAGRTGPWTPRVSQEGVEGEWKVRGV